MIHLVHSDPYHEVNSRNMAQGDFPTRMASFVSASGTRINKIPRRQNFSEIFSRVNAPSNGGGGLPPGWGPPCVLNGCSSDAQAREHEPDCPTVLFQRKLLI